MGFYGQMKILKIKITVAKVKTKIGKWLHQLRKMAEGSVNLITDL